MNSTLLISMPCSSIRHPNLGLSLLKAQLLRHELSCSTRYFNIDYYRLLSKSDYNLITEEIPYLAFAVEWIFAETIYGEDVNRDFKFINNHLNHHTGNKINNRHLHSLFKIKSFSKEFISYCINSIEWDSFNIIGFTTSFQQMFASLGLAKAIKEKYPEKIIVFGGANVEAEMGLTYLNKFHFIDYICSGESDYSFLNLVQSINNETPNLNIEGVFHRNENDEITRTNTISSIVSNLDELPYPHFDDYFLQIEESLTYINIHPLLPLESSRGCWWGQKKHCTFCGLNGLGMSYRFKTDDRIFDEIQFLSSKFNVYEILMVDNILPHQYFNKFIPKLSEEKKYYIHYEVKSNLNENQIESLSHAGVVEIQPGIESMSTAVLKLMDKGVTGLQNVQFLKKSKINNLNVLWNFLFGFPGEQCSDYTYQDELFSKLFHLQPPTGAGLVRADRFSPFFNNPDQFKIKNLIPEKSYKILFDSFTDDEIMGISYHFKIDFDFPDELTLEWKNCVNKIEQWKNIFPNATLKYERINDYGKVYDNRDGINNLEYHLDNIDCQIVDYFENIRSIESLIKHMNFVDSSVLRKKIDILISNSIIITQNDSYLSLVLPN